MVVLNHEPLFSSVEFFITRFFVGIDLILEQETRVPLPTICVNEIVGIFDKEYLVKKRMFGFN
ncbi:hypothetical protein ACFPVX_04680 [Cohnella faecalis]|uniref:Uncharacterized protein n=1 Tax=Cohnella faecalis TaxID=2315694 RepID=A0A398CY53_9BACL|nr:hypothetical protein [Cohnella faecalis]RIE03924.1 hypothetical protein D3H35_08140 [Cohnella faecalis]